MNDTEVRVISCKSLGQVKCPRCYHWSYSVNFDNLCNKCVALILRVYPDIESAEKIRENLEIRGLTEQDNPEYE